MGAPPHLAYLFRCGLANFLPRWALNCDPPDHLLSSWNFIWQYKMCTFNTQSQISYHLSVILFLQLLAKWILFWLNQCTQSTTISKNLDPFLSSASIPLYLHASLWSILYMTHSVTHKTCIHHSLGCLTWPTIIHSYCFPFMGLSLNVNHILSNRLCLLRATNGIHTALYSLQHLVQNMAP
jgi:hypothetical protein